MQDLEARYQAALQAALKGLAEGGIPIGAALYAGDTLVASGHNQRVQKSSPILHGEIDCLSNAGRPDPLWAGRMTLFTTLSPCYMCAGAALIYGVSDIVIGENSSFNESEELLAERGVRVHHLHDAATFDMFDAWTRANPHVWFEDIGR